MADQVGDDPTSTVPNSRHASVLNFPRASCVWHSLTDPLPARHGGLPTNERLEFLGDSVLGIVVTDTLYRDYAESPEGQLARMRGDREFQIASRCCSNDRSWAVHPSRSRRTNDGWGGQVLDPRRHGGGSHRAVYIDRGLPAATDFIHRFFDPVIERASELGAGLDWKSSLQELTALYGLGAPRYVIDQTGPAHDRHFTASVEVGESPSRSKRGSLEEGSRTRSCCRCLA